MNDEKYKKGEELCDKLTEAVNAGTDSSPESRDALDELSALIRRVRLELAEELARKRTN